MRWSAIPALFLMVCIGDAQTLRRRAMMVRPSSSFSPTNIAGMSWYWYAPDAASTNSKCSDWIDRIRGFHALQGNDGNRPTNSAAGLRFNGSQYLSITNAAFAFDCTNDSVLIIANLDAAGVSMAMILGENASPNDGIFQTSGNAWQYRANGGSFGNASGVQDLIIAAGATTTFYTNGVSGMTLSAARSRIDTVGAMIGGSTNFLGAESYLISGYIREIGIWTNTTLTSLNVSNLHFYATNTYGYSP